MFKKLRKDFVLLNMSSIALLMISVLLTIYLFVYQNTISDLRHKVNQVSTDFYNSQPHEGFDFSTLIPSDYTLSFNIKVDSQRNIETIYTFIDMPYDSYEKAKTTALRKGKEFGSLKLLDKTWYYQVHKKESLVLSNSGIKKQIIPDNISFVDMSDAKNTLNNILLAFVIVGSAMMGAIYFISVRFAKKAVSGIEEAWLNQKQFIADASHELKTPLAIIKTNLSALQSDTQQNQWIQNAQSQTTRMDHLIQDLLQLAQSEALDSTQKIEHFNLSQMLQDNLLIFEPQIFESNLRLNSNIMPHIMIESVASQVDQIIKIIFDNAIKYCLDEGLITVSLKQSQKETTLWIENDSETLKEEDVKQVFNRFYRIDKARTAHDASFGLGLAIAKMIADKLGAKISFSSHQQKTTVRIIF